MNVYHEARNQGTAGQIAVAQVTVNRMIDSRFPNTICGVVYQGPHKPSWKGTGEMIPVRHKCQFSWYCDGKSDDIYDNETFSRIYDLTSLMVDDTIRFVDITDGATHYHADYVMPSWASTKTKTVEIEDHIFYRWEK
jgi:spore germination cell wall hydrolase CwlJ-like protein